MLLFFLIAGLASVAILVVFVGSLILGVALQRTNRFKALGVFLLFVPTLAAVGGGASSWGLAFWADAMSRAASTPEWSDRWSVLTFWAWPIGFAVGGLLGAVLGGLASFVIVKRRRIKSKRNITA